MKNKILIRLVVPKLMEEYEIFIPVNERISKIKELVINSLKDLSDNNFDSSEKYNLIDPETGQAYENNKIVRDLGIQNSKRIILF